MISSLYQQGNQLYSLSNNNILGVHDIGDFITLPHTQMPKIQSPLGISLRESTSTFTLSQLSSSSSKFVSLQQGGQFDDNTLLIYDKRRVIALDLINIVSKTLSVTVLYGSTNKNYQLQTGQEIVTVFHYKQRQQHQQHSINKLIISTTKGRLLLFTLLKKSQQQPLFKLKLQQQTSLQKLTNQNNNKNTTTTMEDETKNYLSIYSHNHQNTNYKKQIQYIKTININDNFIYCATTQNKLISIDKNTFLLHVQYQTKQLDQLFIKYKLTTQLLYPIKIIFVRNSLLLLNNKYLLQFNIHTHTLTNYITLPFITLDITVQHHPKTQSSNLIMVGQCNSFFSIPYPWNLGKQKYSPFKRVNISSKLSNSLLQTKNNYLIVAGSDGTIDVYKNAIMHLMVLLLKSQ